MLLAELAKQSKLQEMNFKPDLRTTTFGYALDHVFYRGVIALSGRVVPNITSSDHAPILAKFSISPEKTK